MKQRLKKSLASFLAIIMLVGMLPTSALAAETVTSYEVSYESAYVVKKDGVELTEDTTPKLSEVWNDKTLTVPAGVDVDVQSVNGADVITVTGSPAKVSTAAGASVTVDGDVEKVSASGNAVVTVNGDVTDTNGTWGDSAVFLNNFTGALTVTGAVAGHIYTGGGSSVSGALTIGNTKLTIHEASSNHTYATFDGSTLTVETGKVTNADTAAVPYNIVMVGGTYDSNGYSIDGSVTFKNDLAKTMPTDGSLTGAPVVTDGGAPATPDSLFIKKVIFEDGSAGYVDGPMHSSPKTITVGDNAYAALGYTRVDNSNFTSIGKNATINLVADREHNGSKVGHLNNSGIALAGATNTVANGGTATFLMGEHATLYDAVETPENSNIHIKFYTANTTAQDITVGKDATLTVEGMEAPTYDDAADAFTAKGDALEIAGAGTTSVGAKATLNLTNVWHERDDATRDIKTVDTSKVVLTDTAYHGDTTLGSFETNTGSTTPDVPGAPGTPGENKTGKPQIAIYIDAVTSGLPQAMGEETDYLSVPLIGTDGDYSIALSNAYAKSTWSIKSIILNNTPVAATAKLTGLSSADKLFFVVEEGAATSPDTADKTTNIVWNDANPTIHNNKYIVGTSQTMVVTLSENSIIGSNSTFVLAPNSTIKFVGADSQMSEIRANMDIEKNDVSVILDNINWNVSGANDIAAVRVRSGVKNARLLVEKDSTITGADGADGSDTIHHITATNELHSQSAGVMNNGELSMEAAKGATVTIKGGLAATGPNTATSFIGGAGIYNANNAALTFKGAGVINITGGNGGEGYSWQQKTPQGHDAGGVGGAGGSGITNLGAITDAMTSNAWTEGQLVVTGGTGGNGGQGQKAAQAGHDFAAGIQGTGGGKDGDQPHTTSGNGGKGGSSGGAVYSNSVGTAVTVNSGVFLAYTGTVGEGGVAGKSTPVDPLGGTYYPDAASGGVACTGHSGTGIAGQNGTDATYAITGTNATFNGGTVYAQGGEDSSTGYGIDLSGTATFGGASVWSGSKADSGFDDAAANSLSTDVAGSFAGDVGISAAAYKTSTTPTYNPVATPVRVKFAGLEGKTYRVVDGSVTVMVSGDAPYTLPMKDVYVNPQGFAYLWLQTNASTKHTSQIVSVVVQDTDTGVYYKLQQDTAKSVFDYSSANGYIQLAGTWGEEFTVDGKTYATGVNIAWLDAAKADN